MIRNDDGCTGRHRKGATIPRCTSTRCEEKRCHAREEKCRARQGLTNNNSRFRTVNGDLPKCLQPGVLHCSRTNTLFFQRILVIVTLICCRLTALPAATLQSSKVRTIQYRKRVKSLHIFLAPIILVLLYLSPDDFYRLQRESLLVIVTALVTLVGVQPNQRALWWQRVERWKKNFKMAS